MTQNLALKYRLTYDEVMESLEMVDTPEGKTSFRIGQILLPLLAAVCIFFFFKEGFRLIYLLLAAFAIGIFLFQRLSLPMKHRKNAKKISETPGLYHVTLTHDMKVIIGEETLSLQGDKKARGREGNLVFMIRANRYTTIGIPKRILSEEQKDDIRQIITRINLSTGNVTK